MQQKKADPITPGHHHQTSVTTEELIIAHLAPLLRQSSGYHWSDRINSLLRSHYFHVADEIRTFIQGDVPAELDPDDVAATISDMTLLVDFLVDASELWRRDRKLQERYLHMLREDMILRR